MCVDCIALNTLASVYSQTIIHNYSYMKVCVARHADLPQLELFLHQAYSQALELLLHDWFLQLL